MHAWLVVGDGGGVGVVCKEDHGDARKLPKRSSGRDEALDHSRA